jgi:hypothetical protein
MSLRNLEKIQEVVMTLREEVQQQIQYASEAILERIKSILEEDDELLE